MDIYRTKGDPLARVMRKKLKERGIRRLAVVCSRERPRTPVRVAEIPAPGRNTIPASIFCAACGRDVTFAAGAAVRDLVQIYSMEASS